MADVIARLTPSDIEGAVLPTVVVEDNSKESLIRWLKCRGYTANSRESKARLVNRVKDLQNSGLSAHVIDPDGGENRRRKVNQQSIQVQAELPQPLVQNWTTSLTALPRGFSHQNVEEYLLRRTLTVLGETAQSVELPVAEKPLVKGYNFYGSGHVTEIKSNPVDGGLHVTSKVLSSFKDKFYKVALELNNKGDILKGKCECVAGLGGKCNHVAALLFACLEFVKSVIDPEVSCTHNEQRWHQPSQRSKKHTKPLKSGVRSVKRHVYGSTKKRKAALAGYHDYVSTVPLTPTKTESLTQRMKQKLQRLKSEKHDTAILQILNSDTDTGSEAEDPDSVQEGNHQTPEEKVLSMLQVSEHQRVLIEAATREQADCQEWYSQKKGRLTASKAKSYCTGKSNIDRLVRDVITLGSPRRSKIPAILFGLEHEDCAAVKYANQRKTVTVTKCGLFIDINYGQLGASPDRLVYDSGCADQLGVLEIKCLYSARDKDPITAVEQNQKSSFPVRSLSGVHTVRESHPYYYQMQMQMGVTKRNWCDFVLFTNVQADVLVVRVAFDKAFWDQMCKKLLEFHANNIIPALVAQGFYKGNQ